MTNHGPSLEGCAGIVTGFTLTYLGAEAALVSNPHPVHWLVTLAGAGLGYGVGHVVFLWREGLLEGMWPDRHRGRQGNLKRPSVPSERQPQREAPAD